MFTVAYLANRFPSPVEPYVSAEIDELRLHGTRVVAGSVRKEDMRSPVNPNWTDAIVCLQPIRLAIAFGALCLIVRRWARVSRFVRRALQEGDESLTRRLKAMLHTWLGAYYAVLLQGRKVDHIHVHHGYFGSWIAMVAASLLRIDFSLTLHGSDLLIHDAYLDTKLDCCKFCVTISEYNRTYILKRFPICDPKKITVSRLGVEADCGQARNLSFLRENWRFFLLGAGRLHAVKNHAFLIQACTQLRAEGLELECAIAGAGPERERLQAQIEHNKMGDRVTLLGHVSRSEMNSLYRRADLFVLTSLSEGIPLVLMEAMAYGALVLAPAITGVPELIIPGKTGFLYQPGNVADFGGRILFLHRLLRLKRHASASRLNWIRHAAGAQVRLNFSRRKNLARFRNEFIKLVAARERSEMSEDTLLQQI